MRMFTPRLFGLTLLGLVAGCGDVPAETDPEECTTVSDCTVLVPECRTAAACEAGQCVFENEPDGTEIDEQTVGDCTVVVCDGEGATRIEGLAADIEDDGNPCTLDACDGTTPTHTVQESLPCYSGPAGTLGKGLCTAGAQQCDANGNLVGKCTGEVVPQTETCVSDLDEDCDGQVNEEDAGCECQPGEEQACYTGPAPTKGVGACKDGTRTCNPEGTDWGPCTGEVLPSAEDCDGADSDEDCDGLVNESGSSCTCGDGQVSNAEECDDAGQSAMCDADCTPAVCSDGVLNTAAGEKCDDGNTSSADPCSSGCNPQEVLAVSAGGTHTCALLSRGEVKCWGDNKYGQLGLGNTDSEAAPVLPAIDLGLGATAVAIAAGLDHTCALLSSGQVKCWGYNSSGQLGIGNPYGRGDGPAEMGDNLPAVDLGPGATATAIAAGGRFTCAMLDGGSVKCWGFNGNGRLGLGDTFSRGDQPGEMGAALPAVDLGPGATAAAIALSGNHACALLSSGSVKCWGYNSGGALGHGDTVDRGNVPGEMGAALPAVDLGPGAIATAIDVGGQHSCALLEGGSVKCWGDNAYGQLGLGNTIDRGDEPGDMGASLPAVDLGPGATATSIATGTFHVCALLSDGGVKCWGDNAYGQLGLGNTAGRGNDDNPEQMGASLPAVELGTSNSAGAIATGRLQTCALVGIRVKCWGDNASGQLGLGDALSRGDEPGEMGDALPFVHLFNDQW